MLHQMLSNLLLVEDNLGDARLVQEMLREFSQDIKVTHVGNIQAIQSVATQKFDLILLDLSLPDSTGLKTVIKVHELMPEVPIVVMTGWDNEELSISAIKTGAQDYLVKGKTDPTILMKTLNYAFHRHQVLNRINAQQHTQKAYLSTHDVLTGLPNQQLFLDHLAFTIQKHEITKNPFSLMLLRINEIGKIIGHHGHHTKDELLKLISDTLKETIDKSVFISRYKEEVFALLFPKHFDKDLILQDIGAIKEFLLKRLLIAEREYLVSYNIGVVVYPFDGQNIEELIQNAYVALEKATELGAQEFEIYTKNIQPRHMSHNKLYFSDFHSAMEHDEFFLVYQPQIDLSGHKMCGVEALLRWQHPDRGLIMPGEFIYAAEDCHLMHDIGAWVLDAAIKQYKDWQQKSQIPVPLRLSVNVSIQQFQQGDKFYSMVQNTLKKHDMVPENLEIELTESIFMGEPEPIIEKLKQLRQLGIKISIDDFGQGYSSLSYLSHLPINRLKLDMSFVRQNKKGTQTSTIVESVIKLAHDLHLKVIAEGVETEDQLNLLKKQKCDEVQGYYFSKPVSSQLIHEKISDEIAKMDRAHDSIA